MFAWLSENLLTVIVIAVLLIILGFALFSVIKDKKNHSGGCTGNCASCKMGCCGKK